MLFRSPPKYGALHAIGFMPEVGLGEDFLAARWDEISVGFDVSAYSIKTVAETVLPLMNQGGSIVGLDFDSPSVKIGRLLLWIHLYGKNKTNNRTNDRPGE